MNNYEVPFSEIAYRNIVEWLYVNDGKYPDRNKWREALLEVIRFNLRIGTRSGMEFSLDRSKTWDLTIK